MGATVQDVHHGDGQNVRVRSTNVTVQGQHCGFGSSLRNGEGNTQDGVCAQLALVVSAVQIQHDLVDTALVFSILATDLGANYVYNGLDGILHALALVALLVVIATLHGFESAGRSSGWNRCTGRNPVLEKNVYLDGGIAARIQYLACAYVNDACHVILQSVYWPLIHL